ncbi:MAG: AAA family ATPase [Patescibacteria group bacterium]
MDFWQIKRSSKNFEPAFWAENILKASTAGGIQKLFFFLFIIFAVVSVFFIFLGSYLPIDVRSIEYKAYGGTAVLFALWSIPLAFYSFSNYFRFRDIALTEKEREENNIKISFELAEILYSTDANDLATGLILSDFGGNILVRCGIPVEDVSSFIKERKSPLNADNFPYIEKNFLTPYEYVKTLYRNDKEFADLVFRSGVQEEELFGATRWLNDLHTKIRRSQRSWSKENISKIRPIGEDWAYGVAYELKKFSRPIEETMYISESLENYHEKEIEDLEIILSRSEGANAILVGEAGTGKMSVVGGLASRVINEKTTDVLSHKKIMVMSTGALVSSTNSKAEFESEIITIMEQTAKAGNLILVIDNLPYLIQGARSLGVEIVELIDTYLGSPNINIIALSDKTNFHNTIEPNTAFMSRFEYVLLEEMNEESVLSSLEDRLLSLESENDVMFTFPAVMEMVRSANRYFPSGVMPDKAIDLLVEITPFVKSRNLDIITKKEVEDFIRKKTGIPVGAVSEKEKNTLSNLEEILHKRVVGQDEAVEMVSNALRRARSGVSDPDRPIGSFLFLGPTGVGKTETAKALAEIFFESSENMSRLDMSEYQGQDAVAHLVGSFETGKIGALTRVLREKPYSVLLLDEFEKADKEIHNLFLQTLDEGKFSDPSGKEVNARNSIIVATSNAGSDLIWEYENENKKLKDHTSEIIDSIIERGVLSPELLNRFDGVVLFHSLNRKHLKNIAKIKINDLKERTKNKGVEIEVSDKVIEYLIEKNTDNKFGARELNRMIQEYLEKVIAEKIIEENPKPGSVIDISFEDIKDQ